MVTHYPSPVRRAKRIKLFVALATVSRCLAQIRIRIPRFSVELRGLAKWEWLSYLALTSLHVELSPYLQSSAMCVFRKLIHRAYIGSLKCLEVHVLCSLFALRLASILYFLGLADDIIVQWKQLKEKYPRTTLISDLKSCD